jgi:3-deoxy-manno-octulosonate cytidylyltransferase (CMP-KDO synthetase)
VSAKSAVIIPARYGSTRFPGKPLHVLAGKPLIQHVWERCCRARRVDRVIIATDDKRIAQVASAFGAEVSMTSESHPSGTDRCAEVARRLRGFTHIINVQGDEPLIDPKLISKLADAMKADPQVEMITAAIPLATEEDVQNPNVVKVVIDVQSNALYFSRAPIPYVREHASSLHLRHLGIYGYAVNFLLRFVKWKRGPLEKVEQLEQLRALENGAKIRVVLAKAAAIGVDAPEDVAMVEQLLARA